VEVGIALFVIAIALFWLTFKLPKPPGGEDPPPA
jgi:hypothetical protein